MKLRSVRFFFLLAAFGAMITATGWGQSVYRLPHIANGADAIQTTFLFVNKTSEDAVVTMTIRNQSGDTEGFNVPGLPGGAVKVFNLPARQTRFFTSDGEGELIVGSALITSTQEIGVSAVFQLLRPNGSIRTEAGISASEPLTDFVVAVDTETPFNTGVAIQNLSVSSTTVEFELFDTNGNSLGTASRQIPGRGQIAIFVRGAEGLFPAAPAGKGRMVVSADSQVAALTLRQAGLSPLTTLPVVSTGSSQTEFNIPHVANGGGSIAIQLLIFGTTNLGGNVNVQLTDQNGDPLTVTLDGETGSEFDLNLPAEGAIFVETDGVGGVTTGAARITSDVPVGVSAVFRVLDGSGAASAGKTTPAQSGNVIVEAGVGDAQLLSDFTLPVDTTGAFNTGLALFNPDEATATVEFVFYDENGVETSSSGRFRIDPLTLNALEQLPRFVTEFVEGVDGKQGMLVVRSDVALGAIVLRQLIQAGSNLLTTLNVFPGAPVDGEGPTPGGSNLLSDREEGVDITQNAEVDFTLPFGFRLQGSVTGTPFVLSVQAENSQGRVFGGRSDLLTGDYEVIVERGLYTLSLCGLSGGAGGGVFSQGTTPQQDEFSTTYLSAVETNIRVDGDTTRDVSFTTVNTVPVSGRVNLNNLPSGSTVPAQSSSDVFIVFSSTDASTQGFAMVSGSGNYSIELEPGTYDVAVIIGESETTAEGDVNFLRSSIIAEIDQITVGGGGTSSANFAIPSLVEVEGTVSHPDFANLEDGAVLATESLTKLTGVFLLCFPQADNSFAPINSSNEYSLLVAQNRPYEVSASVEVTERGTDSSGIQFEPKPGGTKQSFPTDTMLDINMSAIPAERTVSGVVRDAEGTPVAEAIVSFTSIGGVQAMPDAVFSASTRTDAQGRYSLTVLRGVNYVGTAEPPLETDLFPFGEAASE